MSIKTMINKWIPNKNDKGILAVPSNDSALDIGYDDKRVITFRIITANGGQIIETSKYINESTSKFLDDSKRVHNLYIIPDGENLTESLSRIITMESLR